MKKSTLLYIALNAVIMLTPILFIVGLRYKIRIGQVIDLKAQAAARYKNIPLPFIHEIEVNSSHVAHRLSIQVHVMDSVNTMGMDTTTYKYITYTLKGDKLLLHYDFEKDSLDNLKTIIPVETEEYYEVAAPEHHRSIVLYVKSNLTAIKATNASVTVDLQNNEKLLNDLKISCDYSSLSLNAPYLSKRSEDDESDEVIPYHFNHHLTLHLLNYSDAELSYFGYIKTFDLELKNESTIDKYIPTGTFNLVIDKKSVYMIDVNDLDKVKVKYE